MGTKIVKIDDIPISKYSTRGKYARLRYNELYEKWFNDTLKLKPGEALEISLDRQADPSLPTDTSIRDAVKRWNARNPDRRIRKLVTKQRTGKPTIYLFPERQEAKK